VEGLAAGDNLVAAAGAGILPGKRVRAAPAARSGSR